MKYKISTGMIVFRIINYLLMAVITIACIVPLWHVLMGSMSNPTAVTTTKGLILTPLKNFDFQSYKIIMNYEKLWGGYLNTLIYLAMQCVLTGVLTVVAGYVFSRKRFRTRNFFMMIISFTMLFNGGMIPTYMVIRKIGLLDTRWAIVLPSALSVFNIIMMRTSMESIPESLEEAARIDGANDFTIMFKIILPLCKATFAVILLFAAIMRWNDFMSALLYLPKRTDLYPLQMTLKTILFNISTATQDMSAQTSLSTSVTMYQKNIEYAVIVVSTLPVLVLYPFVQKYFVSGMTIGAVKS